MAHLVHYLVYLGPCCLNSLSIGQYTRTRYACTRVFYFSMNIFQLMTCIKYDDQFESLLSLVMIILINMAVGILPHVDNFAHLGGFITGFLLGFVLMIRPQFGYISKKRNPYMAASSKSKYKIYQFILLIVSLVTLAAA